MIAIEGRLSGIFSRIAAAGLPSGSSGRTGRLRACLKACRLRERCAQTLGDATVDCVVDVGLDLARQLVDESGGHLTARGCDEYLRFVAEHQGTDKLTILNPRDRSFSVVNRGEVDDLAESFPCGLRERGHCLGLSGDRDGKAIQFA